MNVKRLLRTLVFIIPAFFVYLTFSSEDSFYIILAGITLIFSLLFIFKDVLSSSVIHLPKNLKKFKRKVEKIETEITHEIEDLKPAHRKIKLPLFKLTVILLLNTAVFLLVILTSLSYIDEQNIFVAYYKSLSEGFYSSLLNSLAIIFFFFANVIILFVLLKKSIKKKRKRILSSLALTVLNIILAIHLSFLVGFLYGVGLTNYKVLGVKSNPEKAGLIWGKDKVKEKLQKMDKPPKIEGSHTDMETKIANLVLRGKEDSDSFFVSNLLTSIPKSLVVKLEIPDESLISYNDYLIITKINKNEIEEISPIIAKKFVENYLDPRYIKGEPYVRLMSRQDYLKYRDDKINEQIADIDALIEEAQENINVLYSSISQAKQKIAENEQGINDSIGLRDYYYEQCKSAGYYSYYFGYFYRYYSDEECNRRRTEWDSLIAEFQQNINDWNNTLAQSQGALPEWQEWKKTLEDVKVFVVAQKDSVPQELGLFEPEKNIKVVLESTSTESLADFFTTLVHEYYHYSSYVSEERTLPQFFEEGLTEYFARKTIRENMDIQTQLGYPMITRIIEEIAEKVPEDKLEEIYFTKNEEALIALLNDVYGKTFYDDSNFYFTAIYFMPVTDETVKFANNIMFKIGGEELKVDDLTSYRSKF